VAGVAVTGENERAIDDGQIVVLAVKPDQVDPVCRAHAATLRQRLLISVAAGVSLRQLIDATGAKRVVRVMPNTPCLVGAGASAFCRAGDTTDADVAAVQTMLAAVGDAVEVPEKLMDAVTGLSGSGPAYVFLIIEALADGGVAAGLPRAVALRLAAQTVQGAAKMVADTGEHPGALKDAVASPGGTTIAGLAVLEENAVRGALIAAVGAAARRSRELGDSGK
jgi:pyrroline-5-carboxylate reductase